MDEMVSVDTHLLKDIYYLLTDCKYTLGKVMLLLESLDSHSKESEELEEDIISILHHINDITDLVDPECIE